MLEKKYKYYHFQCCKKRKNAIKVLEKKNGLGTIRILEKRKKHYQIVRK